MLQNVPTKDIILIRAASENEQTYSSVQFNVIGYGINRFDKEDITKKDSPERLPRERRYLVARRFN